MSLSVWQIAGGPAARSYADIFIQHGIGLIGPGDSGPWTPEREDDVFEGGYVRRFASEVKQGDVFLLRTGVATICAIGVVASDYLYLHQFDDVNGWDLQHGRRVHWCQLPQEYSFDGFPFGASPARFSRVQNEEVIDYATRFLNSPPTYWQVAALPELPKEEPALEEIPRSLQSVVAELHDLFPLFWDRDGFGEHPAEDELIVHGVVPFLRALGWPPELIAIKWRYIDVALFNTLPRTPENCRYVIEVKRLGAGVDGALQQAQTYVKALGINCDIVVTDGIRYRMYAGHSDFESIAYANLVRLKQSASVLFSKLQRY